MQSAQIRNYEKAIVDTWDDFESRLEDNFSLSAVVDLSAKQGFSISNSDWDAYFKQLVLPKSKVKYFEAINDNEMRELTEVELDYVVGGVAAVPVLAVTIAVVTYAAVGVSIAVGAVVVVAVGASLGVAASVWAWVLS